MGGAGANDRSPQQIPDGRPLYVEVSYDLIHDDNNSNNKGNGLRALQSFRLVTVLILSSAFAANSRGETVQQKIDREERMNEYCQAGSGDDPQTARFCQTRDRLLSELKQAGWCSSHDSQPEYEKQWEPCARPRTSRGSDEPQRSIEFPGAGAVYFQVRSAAIHEQNGRCQEYGAAGNPEMQTLCYSELVNADEFLTQLAQHSPVPQLGWTLCLSDISDDFSLGARCIVAFEDICRLNSDGQLLDYSRCLQTMTSRAWVVNPKASALSFNRPLRVSPDLKR